MDRGWDRPKDKTREMESDSCDGTRERLPATRGRDGEMDWREREKRRDGDYRVNGRIESVSERGDNRDRENERGKGDTFPRITRPSKERDGRIPLQEYERQYQTGRPKEMQYESERERERERERRRQRDAQRYRDLDIQSERDRTRNRDEMRKNETRRLLKEDPERWREQEREFDSGKRDRRRESYPGVNDHWSISEREAGRERDRHRQRERDSRFYSPQLRHNEGERDNFSGKEERAERQREGQRPRRRDTRSEGDSDGDREKERRKEEDSKLGHKHYKSEGDSEAEKTLDRIRERDRRKEREVERHRELAMLRERETDYQGPRGERSERYREPGRLREGDIEKRTERPKDRMRDTQGRRKDYMERDAYSYTTERGRYKEGERTRERDRYIERVETAERERRRRENRETGRSNLSLSEANREKNGQSTGERISGGDAENEQGRPKRENFEKDNEKESSKDRDKEGMFEIDKEKLKGKKEGEQDKDRKLESNMEKPKRKPRKMWLEPRSGNERKESSLEDEYIEREKARERYIQRYKTTGDEEQSYTPREPEREQERMSLEDRYRELEKAGEFARDLGVEREEKRRSGGMEYDREELEPHWQMEKDNVTDDTEEIDQEEKRGNNNARLENEEGSEGESEEEKDKIMSADDGFVTVSSGGEDDFEDCKEFWDGGVRDDLTEQSKQMQDKEVRKDEDMENKTTNESDYQSVTLFCVVGQTHDSSQAKDNPLEDHTAEEMTGQHLDHDNQAEVNIANVNEDSEKDRSTVQDIEREMDDLTLSHKEDEDSHDTKGEETGSNDQSAKDATLPEGHMIENEPLPPEPSETSELIKDNGSAATEAHSENTLEEGRKENTEATVEHSNSEETWASADERKRYSSAPHLKWAKSVVKEILDSESLVVDKENARGTHIDTQSNTQTESEREMDELREEKGVMEGGEEEKGGMEKESNEGSEHDWLDPGSVQDTFSSEGELDREGGEIEAEKRDSVKELSVLSSSSFRDLGNEARIRRRGFRKSAEKRSEEEEGEGVGRDRRTRIFNISDEDEEEFSFSWSEVDLRKVTESLRRPIRRNSKFFNSQLYQEYSEVVQNREIQLSHSDSIALSGDYSGSSVRSSSSPNHSPKPQHRPLPALPPVPLHPHTLSITNSFRSLIVPQQVPNRPPSPRLSISASSPTLWQDLPGVRSSPELEDLAEDERRLQEVRFEVVTSEASYCRSLDIVVEHFVKSKQLNVLLTSQDKNWLFSRLSDVRAISHSFLSQLEERVESDIMHFTVCDIIIKHCPRFRKVYVPYLTNQSYQDKTYQRLMDENHEFRRSVEKLERNPVCQRLPLRSFLILPFQRITRLKLLVQNIVKRTAPKTKDEAQAIKAMKLLEKMIQESNDSISQMKNIESLVSLSAKVDFECRTLPLISQSRRLVREGPVTELRDFSLKETERSVYMHLFNDYLLLSLRKEGGRFTVIDHAPVSELRAENCRFKLHSLQKNLFRLHTAHKALLLRTDTQAEKLRWISALSRPHPEIDFSAVQDFAQVQCIRAYVAQQPDELSLEKADVLLVHQQSTDGWVEGTRLSDRQRGWAPDTHLETIVSDKAKKRNLLDTMKIASAAM